MHIEKHTQLVIASTSCFIITGYIDVCGETVEKNYFLEFLNNLNGLQRKINFSPIVRM